jgi:hypothetical protein
MNDDLAILLTILGVFVLVLCVLGFAADRIEARQARDRNDWRWRL